MRKKVVIFIYSLGGGGAEKVALELANGLKDTFDISIVTVSPVQNYASFGIEVVSLYKHDIDSSSMQKAISIFKLAFIFANYCRKNSVDVVLSCLTRPTIIAAISKLIYPKLRLVATEHTTPSGYYGNSFAQKALKAALSISYKIANAVVAVSNGIKNDLCQNFGVKKDKITVIYNPVDTKKIRILALQKASRQQDSFIFVSAGRLVESKNYPFLFKAFATLEPFCRLWILGAGEMERELKFLAVEMGIYERVHFFGFCENPYSYFAAADCFVMSSRLEGLPIVLIEALACSLPVISTDCKSGPREILGGMGDMLISGLEKADYGVLVGLDTHKFLSVAMQKMIEDDKLRQEYRLAALKRAEFFSKEKSIESYKNLIIGVSA